MVNFNNKVAPSLPFDEDKKISLDFQPEIKLKLVTREEVIEDYQSNFSTELNQEDDNHLDKYNEKEILNELELLKDNKFQSNSSSPQRKISISTNKIMNTSLELIQDKVSRSSSLSKTSYRDSIKQKRHSRIKIVNKTRSIASLSKNSQRTHSSAFELKMAMLEEHLQKNNSTPTTEAIDDINQELKALESNLIDIDSSDSQSLVSSSINNENIINISNINQVNNNNLNNNNNNKKQNIEYSMNYLMKENTRLHKLVDKLQFELSQKQTLAKVYEGNSELKLNNPLLEDVPIAYTSLKSKLVESQETILKQKEMLEVQDNKIQELERKINNLSDTLVLDQIYKTQYETSLNNLNQNLDNYDLSHRQVRDSLLIIDNKVLSNDNNLNLSRLSTSGLDEDVRNFVTNLFTHHRNISFNQSNLEISDPILTNNSITNEMSFSLPIYSIPSILNDDSFNHNNTFGLNNSLISRKTSIRELLRAGSNLSNNISLKRSSTLPVHSTKLKVLNEEQNDFESITINEEECKQLNNQIKELKDQIEEYKEKEIQNKQTLDSLKQHYENNELKLKRNHQEAIHKLVDQIERLKLDANTFQLQLQEITRKHSAIALQLEEANNHIIELQEKDKGFLCFG